MYERVNEILGTTYKSDQEIDWMELSSSNYILSEFFIEEFKDKLYWDFISAYQPLTEDFMRKHQDRLKWNIISQNQVLSWNFILEFKDRVSWRDICRYQPFIEDPEYLKIDRILLNSNRMYNLYQETKERGWFFSFRELNFARGEKNFYYYLLRITGHRRYRYQKIRVYWKDLIMLNKTKKYEPIRLFKYV